MEEERTEGKGIYNADEIEFGKLSLSIWRSWKFIAICTAAVTIASFVMSLFIQPVYRATAVILPINKSLPSVIEGGRLSTLIGLVGLEGGSSSSTINAILKSNSIKENIILKHDLMKFLFADDWDDKNKKWNDKPPNIWEGIKEMDDLVRIEEDKKTGAISVSTEFSDPNIAADISRWFIEELRITLKEKSFSMARHQSENIEEILGTLKGHLMVPEGDLPDISIFMRKMRDLEISEKAYEELMVQYYLAKFQEAKEDIVFQVIDEAKPPYKPVKPRRLVMVALGMTVGLLLSIFYVVIFR